ncbi:MAG: flagellar basal body rod protein FlgB [Alicyclobacillus sp.]|nr:flagellar basal body rod protein FlgB [Alicyclobacillus sp.]
MATDSVVFQILQNALNAANLRQTVYANNIANADTPGFKRSDVAFESLLASALGTGTGAFGTAAPNWSAALGVQPVVTTDATTSVDNNGNNVNVDDEMVSLAENQLRYNALTEDVSMRLTRLQTAINGG